MLRSSMRMKAALRGRHRSACSAGRLNPPAGAAAARLDYSMKVVKAETGSRSLTREFSMRDGSAYPSDMLQTITSSCGIPVISRTIVWK